MWYSGYGSDSKWRIFHATSSNGLDWVKYTNAIPANSNTNGTYGRIPMGSSGGDSGGVIAPAVVKTDNGYLMWYAGSDGTQWKGVYLARSSDGLTWRKVNNALPTASNAGGTDGRIPLGTGAGRGDITAVYRACPLLEQGLPFRIWYMGSDGSWRTFYATQSRPAPAVTNLAVVNIGANSASLVGRLLANDSDPARLYVFRGLTNGGFSRAAWPTNADLGVKSFGIYTNSLTGLAGSTKYYYRFYGTNGLGEGWANPVGVFSTLGAPRVSNGNGATAISGTSATLRGEVLGGNPNPTIWMCWGANNAGQTSTSLWQNARSLGAQSDTFSLMVTNLLTASKRYYYTCFATNSYGGTWSAVTNFISDKTTVTVNNSVTWEPGNGKITNAIFRVSLSRLSATNVSFYYATSNGTATAGTDYLATNRTHVVPAGTISNNILVKVKGDATTESGGETYYLNLSAPTNVYLARTPVSALILDPGATYTLQWDGGGSDDRWSTRENWYYDSAPTNPTAHPVRFDQVDNGGRTLLDPENVVPVRSDWRVGSLAIANSLSSGTVDFKQIHDLNGKRLVVDGNMSLASAGVGGSSWARAHFTNGTLQVGTTNQARTLTIGSIGGTTPGYGELKVCPGAVFEPHLSTLVFGSGGAGGGIMDLRGATVAGGVLDVQDLRFCTIGGSGGPYRTMFLLLNSATGLTEFRIRRYFDFAYHQMYYCRIGDPDNGYKLPPNISFTIGSLASRGRLYMAYNPYMAASYVKLEATSGGQFVGYLTDMIVHPGYFGTGKPVTLLDIRGMTNVLLDITGQFSIGSVSVYGYTEMGYDARVKLCPGAVSCKNLILGTSLVSGSLALLDLNGTAFAVTNSATLGDYGRVSNHVQGVSCGLNLRSNATLSVTSPGKICLDFVADQSPSDPSPVYWGLRWPGDHQAFLAAMRTAGTLVWTNRANPVKSVNIYYDDVSNITYVALMNPTGPTAISRDLDLELRPPTWTNVVIAVGDADAGSLAGGYPITNRTISCPQNLTPTQPYITLGAVGIYTGTLTVADSAGLTDTDKFMITIRTIQGGTTANLTWDGGAVLERMPRHEWFWAQNWVGDTPPTNPTGANLTFGDTGFVKTNRLDANRRIGALTVNNTSGTHLFDLQGKTLAITNGNVFVSSAEGGYWAGATFSNGTLQIGTPRQPRTVYVGSGSSFYFGGILKVAPGAVLEPYIATLLIGNGAGGRGNLDLRGATVAGGVLRAVSLLTANGGHGSLPSRNLDILIDETTGLNRFDLGSIDMGSSQSYTTRIGDPAKSYNLPPNVSFTIGASTNRGYIKFGIENYPNTTARIVATNGGFCTAYLNYVQVGGLTFGPGTGRPTLDLSRMSNVLWNVSGNIEIPRTNAGSGAYVAIVKLPPGTVTARDVLVGKLDVASCSALFELNGTTLTATRSVTVGPKGILRARGTTSTRFGLDLPEATTLSVSDGGILNIVFNSLPNPAARPLVGLRWGGEHVAELQSLYAAGKLTWDNPAIEIYRFAGYTQVGVEARGTVMMFR